MKKYIRVVLRIAILALILAASVVVYYAYDMSYVVVVDNQSDRSLSEVRVVGGGCEVDFGDIKAGDVESRRFWVKADGHLTFHSDGDDHDIEIDGYVTPSLGGRTTVTIKGAGVVSSINNRSE